MTLSRPFVRFALVGLLMLGSAGCASASKKTDNTLIGAGLGAAAGAVFSSGDPLYTIGGAAAGGLLGNILTEDRRERNWNNGSNRRHVQQRHVNKRHYRDEGRRHDNRGRNNRR